MLPPPKNFWKLGLRKRHILHSLNRTQLIHTCILLSFSQSLVTHDSRAEVQRFMIPNFLKQKFMILTCFVAMIHDSWFRFHPRSYYKVDEYLPLTSEKKYMYRLYSVLYNFGSTFRSPSTVRRTRLSKIILINPTFRPHFVCELSIDIISLQTFLRKKVYCFKFATIMKGMFRCENQIIVPQATFITNHQTCKSFHSRESNTVLNSAADSWFQVLDSSFWQWNLDSWFQSLVGFRIP